VRPEVGPGPLRWRPAAFLLLGASVSLFGVGVLLRNPAPVVLALPLLLAPVCAGLFGPRRSPVVRVEGARRLRVARRTQAPVPAAAAPDSRALT